MTLPDGLYDLLLTEGLTAKLEPQHSEIQTIADGGSDYLVDALARQLAGILDDVSGDGTDKLRRQLDLVNTLLVTLRQELGAEKLGADPAEIVDRTSRRFWVFCFRWIET